MMHGLRLSVSLSLLLFAPAALANPGDEPPPDGSTVIVVTPPAPLVVGIPSHPAPPGAAEMPPQPVAAPAAPAPQNEAWSNVSHINGTPIPVGQRGDYLYKVKKTNISSNPIGWMMGFYGVSISQALGAHVAVRGDANLFRELKGDGRGYEFGITLPLYFKHMYRGPFIEPGVLLRDFDTNDNTGAFAGPQVNIGWHWTFDSGLNLSAAIGLARRLDNGSDMEDSFESPIEPTGYFRVGYAY